MRRWMAITVRGRIEKIGTDHTASTSWGLVPIGCFFDEESDRRLKECLCGTWGLVTTHMNDFSSDHAKRGGGVDGTRWGRE